MRELIGSTVGVLLAIAVAAMGGCVFDESGVRYNSNDNASNSNTNTNASNNNNQVNTVCGNSVIEGGEGCDDGNAASGDGCGSDCQPEPGWVCNGTPSVCALTCGNGALDLGETCDDGNTGSGDGCNGQCQEELGWDCSTLPCEPVCGDSVVVGDEGCDDGNAVVGDGCSDCTVEPFFACADQPSVCHCVIYVNHAAVGGTRTGASWDEAHATVQAGINTASADCEVWVAEGDYYLWQGSDNDTLNLKSYVSVYGGFAGGETQLNQRDWIQNTTVLSGYNGPAETERVFHVVTADGVTGALLSGFTVTGGDARYAKSGGGIRVHGASVVLSQLRVADNDADIGGGGVYAYDSTVTLTRSVITGNYAYDGGGVDVARESQLTVSRCRFLANTAERGGGLRVFDFSTATVSSSLFADNSANSLSGGAIVNWSSTDLTVTNCTIYRNTADNDAGAIRNYTASSCTVRNSILWANVPEDFDDVGAAASLSYTIVGDSGFAGSNGNLSTDPLLVLPGFTLAPSSVAIDTADDAFAPPTGLGGNAPVDITGVGTPGTLADRGCFEFVP